MKGIIVFVSALMAVAIILSISGCTNGKENAYNYTASVSTAPHINSTSEGTFGHFLFLSHITHVSGENIEGRYPDYKCIDFPGYYFSDHDMDTLIITNPVDINVGQMDKLVAIVGEGTSLGDVFGMGAYSRAIGVYILPAQGGMINVSAIDKDGTAHLQYHREAITLKPGEKWVNQSSRIEASTNDTTSYKTNITTTDTIENFGFWNINSLYECHRTNG